MQEIGTKMTELRQNRIESVKKHSQILLGTYANLSGLRDELNGSPRKPTEQRDTTLTPPQVDVP